jgi:Xaa-Pro aminopeptidase
MAVGLFNLRGSDISYNPVFFSYAIVTMSEARLYVDESQLRSEVTEHLCSGSEGGVRTFPYSSISSHLCELIEGSGEEGKIWVDSHSSQALCSLVPKARRVKALSPIQLLKGIKNQTEIEGMKNAHVRAML